MRFFRPTAKVIEFLLRYGRFTLPHPCCKRWTSSPTACISTLTIPSRYYSRAEIMEIIAPFVEYSCFRFGTRLIATFIRRVDNREKSGLRMSMNNDRGEKLLTSWIFISFLLHTVFFIDVQNFKNWRNKNVFG